MGDYTLAHVRERSIGSLFFSIFGGLWLFVGFLAFGLLHRWVALVLVLGMAAFLAAAVWLMRAVPSGVKPEPQRELDGGRFGLVNAVQGVAIFFDFFLANHFHHPNIAFPIAVLIVGLHMFALPRSYRTQGNLITGAILVAAAAACMAFLHGDTMVGAVTMCAGLTLWCSAVWKLRTAFQLLQIAGLASSRT